MKKTILTVIITILVVVFVGGAVFMYLNKKEGLSEIPSIEVEMEEEGDSEEVKEPEEKDKYAMYQNDLYGFSFEYPQSWYLLQGGPDSSVIIISDIKEESGDGGVPLGAVIDFYVSENYDNLSVEDWIAQQYEYVPPIGILDEYVFTGNSGEFLVKVQEALPSPVDAGSPRVAYKSIKNGEFILQIGYFGRNPNYTQGFGYFEHALNTFLEM